MASSMSHTEEEDGRAIRMAAAALDLINIEVALRDGRLGEQTNARLLQRREEATRDLDPEFAPDLASRLGEEALRDAVEQHCPPSSRASIDELTEREGGMVPIVQDRILRMSAVPTTDVRVGDGFQTLSNDGWGCALGAIAIVGGAYANSWLGGIAVVGGIVMMASYC